MELESILSDEEFKQDVESDPNPDLSGYDSEIINQAISIKKGLPCQQIHVSQDLRERCKMISCESDSSDSNESDSSSNSTSSSSSS